MAPGCLSLAFAWVVRAVFPITNLTNTVLLAGQQRTIPLAQGKNQKTVEFKIERTALRVTAGFLLTPSSPCFPWEQGSAALAPPARS